MIKQYKIYNFDHGVDNPFKTEFGPFEITIEDYHCENRSKIPRDKRYTESWDFSDATLKPIIIENEEINGAWVETLIVKIDDKNIAKSVLYADDYHNIVDDLCLILSFAGGRRVLHEKDRNFDSHNPRKHRGKIIYENSLFCLNSFKWENIINVKKHKLGIQFYNLTLAYECNDLIATGAYVNSCFNAICDSWISNKKKLKKILNKKTNGNLLKTESKKKINSEIQEIAYEYFKKEEVHPILIEDFNERLNELWRVTVTTQNSLFLEYLDLVHFYDNNSNEETAKRTRLSLLSNVRNHFAHCGDIPQNLNYPYNMRQEISLNVTSVVLQIVQYYFATEILKMNDPYLSYVKKQIGEYFYNGVVGGKKIFHETHEEAMERMKEEWLKL